MGTRVYYATHLRQENFISYQLVIYATFLRSATFPYNSVYTTYVESNTKLGKPVVEAAFLCG